MEIIQFLIFGIIVVVAIVQQVTKSAKKEEAARKQRPIAVFPVEVEEEMIENKIVTPAPIKRKNKQPKQNMPSSKVQSATAKNSETAAQTSGKRIKLTTREEAKRAFIYSEIFNRKY